jgi:uncharacterized protein YecT (DUF1311 family)
MQRHVAILILAMACGPASAASFDCSKARTPAEKLVCADAQLSKQDEALAAAYKAAQAKADRSALAAWQRIWLAGTRDQCLDAACMRKAYAEQIAELEEHAQVGAGSTVSGRYVRYEGRMLDSDAASLILIELKGGRVRLAGSAQWAGNVQKGQVNVGEVAGIARIAGNRIAYKDADADGCSFLVTLARDSLKVSGDNGRCGGMRVTFDGDYRRVSGAK